MTRALTDQKNLQEALEVRRSGFRTKIHASPHKNEIDKWIIERRWSSNMIVNELKRLYPNEDHPSNRGIDNYRHRYLPAEFAKGSKPTEFSDELRDSIVRLFEPLQEGIKLWNLCVKMLESANTTIAKTTIVPKFCIDLVKAVGEVYERICNERIKLGFDKAVPTAIEFTAKSKYEPGEFRDKIAEIIAIKGEMDKLEEEIRRGGEQLPSELLGDGGKGVESDKHDEDDGKGAGV